MSEKLISSKNDQINFDFLAGMAARMDFAFHSYGDFRANYHGRYKRAFLCDLQKTLRPFIKKWKVYKKGTTANGNALVFCLERLVFYACGGETKSGKVRPGSLAFCEDLANGAMIEATMPQIGGAAYHSEGRERSPGFAGESEKEIETTADEVYHGKQGD